MSPPRTDLDVLRRLVAFPTVSARGTRDAAEWVARELDAPGVVIDQVAGTAKRRKGADDADQVSVIIRKGPESAPDRAGLILSGHLDVVPAEEPDWRTDPFELVVDGDRAYGRGACDMKGFIAVAMNRFRAVEASSLAAPLVLLLTCDEEVGSMGMEHLAASWPGAKTLPRHALIGEPTGLDVVRLHKGHLKLRIKVKGGAAHSGLPHLGQNAIEPAARIVGALAALRAELDEERTPESSAFGKVPQPALNVARIDGGEAINIVPERCVIEVGVRLLPGMASDVMVERVRAAVARAAEKGSGVFSAETVEQTTVPLAEKTPDPFSADVEIIGDNPPLLVDAAAPIAAAACAWTGAPATRGVSFASDGGFMQRELGIDGVLCGPGSMDVAHRANEFVSVAELKRAGEMIDAVVGRMCTEGEG